MVGLVVYPRGMQKNPIVNENVNVNLNRVESAKSKDNVGEREGQDTEKTTPTFIQFYNVPLHWNEKFSNGVLLMQSDIGKEKDLEIGRNISNSMLDQVN